MDRQSERKIWQKALEQWFQWKISLRRIDLHCKKLTMPQSLATSSVGERNGTGEKQEMVQVSCVQRKIRAIKRIEEYIDLLHCFVRQAAEDGSQLVVFPEYNFLDLLGLIPGFSFLNAYLTYRVLTQQKNTEKGVKDQTTTDVQGEVTPAETIISPAQIFAAMAKPVERGMEAIISHLAKGYGIYVYSGTYVVEEEGVLFNIGSLYGPDGQRYLRQKKLHVTSMEEAFGMGRGTSLELADLPIGRLVLPICMDATYFETFRLANKLGAEMVIVPIANPEEYNVWKALKGIWPRIQESHLFGLKASLNGWLAGMHYTGKAGIFAPIAMTPNQDGVLALSSRSEEDELVTAILDRKGLQKEREGAEYFGYSNPEFEREYVERTYFRTKEG